MSQQENIPSYNEIPLSSDKDNIEIIQNKSITPEKPKDNASLDNLSKIRPIFLDNKFSKEDNDKILLINNIKYGIDESGNPINIKEYYKTINDSVNMNSNASIFSGLTNMMTKLKRPIAYITKDENDNNILVDLKGNKITTKNKDGDYDFPLQLHVIIKDFDVKHPELRVNGERYYKDNILNEDIEIKKEIEEEKQKDLSLINKTPDSASKYYGRGGVMPIWSRGGGKNEYGNFMCNSNINSNNFNNNNNKNNYFTKYNSINLFEGSNDKVVLRTNDILNCSNSQSPDYFRKNKNKINQNFIVDRKLMKNNSFLAPILKTNTINFLNLKYKRDLSDSHKIDKNIKNIKKIFEPKYNINSINSNISKKKGENSSVTKVVIRNNGNTFDEKWNTEANENNDEHSNIYPNRSIKNEIQRKLKNNNLNNYRYVAISQKDDSNCNTGTHNYFIIKHNKSFNNSKLYKKRDNNEGKEKSIKKKYKKIIFIPINDDKNTNRNIIFDLPKASKNNNIVNKPIKSALNSKKVKNKIRKNQDLSQKKKKVEQPQKDKIIKINKSKTKYYVLSEEANNMIKSYSKKKYKRENELTKIESAELSKNKKSPNFKLKKKIILSNDNNFNNSYLSPMNKKMLKNKKNKENILKQSLDRINQKYVGITLSLPNKQNNKDKIVKTSGNNQININFTPCQIHCESIIKSNNTNNIESINNIIKRKGLNEMKNDNKSYINNYFSPNNKKLYLI